MHKLPGGQIFYRSHASGTKMMPFPFPIPPVVERSLCDWNVFDYDRIKTSTPWWSTNIQELGYASGNSCNDRDAAWQDIHFSKLSNYHLQWRMCQHEVKYWGYTSCSDIHGSIKSLKRLIVGCLFKFHMYIILLSPIASWLEEEVILPNEIQHDNDSSK